jgi:hypothetical protein
MNVSTNHGHINPCGRLTTDPHPADRFERIAHYFDRARPHQALLTLYWLRVSSQVRSTARVVKSQRFVEIALADAGSPFFWGQNGEK